MRPTHLVCACLLSLPLFVLSTGPISTARADLVGLTGDAAVDLPASNPNVFVIQDRVDDVAQSSWITSRGWTTGWNIQDLRVGYDAKSDKLTVGVNFIGIAGDSDGNGDPGGADPLTTASGGIDPPHLGGRKSISVGFAKLGPNGTMGDTVLVAGVPAIKTPAGGGGIDGFTVAHYVDNGGLAYSYGTSLAGNVGNLAFDPSAAHPDFVFTLSNVSQLAGFNPVTGFWISAFAGSPDDVVAGEDTVNWTHVPGFLPVPQIVPEPSSLVLMSLGAGFVCCVVRRRKAVQVQVQA